MYVAFLIADGADYTGGLYTATFSGSSTTSVPVPTLSDNVLEGLETFTGVIQVPPETTTNYRVTAGSSDTATVNIIDATSEFSICATLSSYMQFYMYIDNTQLYLPIYQPLLQEMFCYVVANVNVQVPSATVAAFVS